MTDNLDILNQFYDQLAKETPYYGWLGFEREALETGRIVITELYVLATLIDARAMGTIIAALM